MLDDAIKFRDKPHIKTRHEKVLKDLRVSENTKVWEIYWNSDDKLAFKPLEWTLVQDMNLPFECLKE